MKFFEVYYINKGKKAKTLYRAPTKSDAITMAKLKSPGVITKVIEVSAPPEEQFKIFKEKLLNATVKSKIPMPDLVAAIRQLAVMTNAGISIHDSIKEVASATEHKHLKSIFESVDDSLNSGNGFTESLMPYKSDLGDVTIAMVQLGESTGNMGESLLKLAEIQDEIWDNKMKFKKAIRYPISVMIAIAVAFTILMLYVVPKFREIFEELGAELPLPTKILLNIEYVLSNYGLVVLGALVLIVVVFKYMYANNDQTKAWVDKNIFKVYLIGDIVFYSTLSRFQLVFTELVRAGIPIAESLDTSLLTIDNVELKKVLGSVKVGVERGTPLTEAFKETGLYESMLIQMVKAGEASGNLDAMLEKVADYFRVKFNDIIENISSYIEPLLIGCIAGIVLLLALGIFMPMWDMAKAVKG